MSTLPSLFVSHGAPNLMLGMTPARQFLSELGSFLPQRPEAIVMISAHWETATTTVSAPLTNKTIYDFGGFEREL